MLSRLSNNPRIGLVERLALEDRTIFRAHADRYIYTVLHETDDAIVFESIGPKAVRMWQVDDPADVDNAFAATVHYFGSQLPGLQELTYLFTEHAWFIWRQHRQSHLPRIKRRVFAAADRTVTVVHSRQNDADGHDVMEYVVETAAVILRLAMFVSVDENGEYTVREMEPTHAVDGVGF